jgi:hypothetical protein
MLEEAQEEEAECSEKDYEKSLIEKKNFFSVEAGGILFLHQPNMQSS